MCQDFSNLLKYYIIKTIKYARTIFLWEQVNKTTNKYEYPEIANKIDKYKCPFCEKDVIFRNGEIKQPHFAHYKSDNAL